VIGLNAVIQDGNDNSFAWITFAPGGYDVHVESFLASTMLYIEEKGGNFKYKTNKTDKWFCPMMK
jgi:hypothetical protein